MNPLFHRPPVRQTREGVGKRYFFEQLVLARDFTVQFHKTPADSDEFCRVIERSLGPGWSSFVRVQSKGKTDGETTIIYANPNAGSTRMMIVNMEPSEAQVIEVSLSDRDVKKWLKEPGEEAEHQSGHHHEMD